MNKVILTGTIFNKSIYYKPAEQGKRAMISFSFGVRNNFKTKATDKYETTYLKCVAWGDTADFINRNFTNGQAMEISSAELVNNVYEKNGKKHYETVVNVRQVEYAPKSYIERTNIQPDYSNEEETAGEGAFYPTDEEIEELMKMQPTIPDFFKPEHE